MRYLLLALALFSIQSYSAQKVFNKSEISPIPSEKQPVRSIYLIGDAGEAPDDQSGVKILGPMLQLDPEASVIFLGDNIYPRGLHKKSDERRTEDEASIIAQMDVVKGHKGPAFFIPGNHDWEQGKPDGRDMVKRQQKFVEDYLGDDDHFMPDKACPGPEIVEVGDVVIIAIDTQWWLHRHEKSIGEADGCNVLDAAGFMVDFKEALKKYRAINTWWW
ncbi:MAG: hypothetical protein O2867_09050 [Bacteroidetes bacterium]|nr:hypothetical protein [Bacteroidota bacterium]MDA0973868.1 hypothetical protein [Bacteroidota bacterium]